MTREESPLASVNFKGGAQQVPFRFDADALQKVWQPLMYQVNDQSEDNLFVNEVGPLELRGGGLADALKVLSALKKPQVWRAGPCII